MMTIYILHIPLMKFLKYNPEEEYLKALLCCTATTNDAFTVLAGKSQYQRKICSFKKLHYDMENVGFRLFVHGVIQRSKVNQATSLAI